MTGAYGRDDADGGTRGRRPELSAELVRTIASQYGLGPPAELTDLGGSVHLNLRWATGTGRDLVVRVYRTHVNGARLTAIQQARRALSDGGVPAARIVESGAGAPFVSCGAQLAEAEAFVESDAIMDDWDRLAAGLPLLGRIHSLLAAAAKSEAGQHPLFANYVGAAGARAATRHGTERIRSWGPTAAEVALADAAERLAETLHEAEAPLAARLPGQLVHGDFWHNNVLFWRDEPVLVADLDFMGSRPRVDDLALTLFFALSEIGEHLLRTEGLDRAAGWVRRYQAGLDTRLSADELAALPLAIARQPLWSIGSWVARLDDQAAARRHLAGCGPELRIALAIIDDMSRWRDALS